MKKLLATIGIIIIVLLGFICLGDAQDANAKVINTVPKTMRGTWYDKYGGKSIVGARYLTNIDHFDHKISVTHYHLATHSPAIKKWVNHTPQYDKVTRNERINSYSKGRVVIWWQEDGAKTGTMHPTYYQLSHKMINGRKYPKLIESTGAGYGINPLDHYRVMKLPKAHGLHYYQHCNKIKITKNTRAYRVKITIPYCNSKFDSSVLLKKGTILKVIYPGTTWSWVIVGSHKFPKTSKHLWEINRNGTRWFKVLHHYKAMMF